jgi:hypothetical protein
MHITHIQNSSQKKRENYKIVGCYGAGVLGQYLHQTVLGLCLEGLHKGRYDGARTPTSKINVLKSRYFLGGISFGGGSRTGSL